MAMHNAAKKPPSRERATGVEPATSSLGSFLGPCGQGFFGGGSRNGITRYGPAAVAIAISLRPSATVHCRYDHALASAVGSHRELPEAER